MDAIASMQRVDAYLRNFTERTFIYAQPSEDLLQAARSAADDATFKDSVVSSFRRLPFVSAKAMQLVLRYDQAADSVPPPQRLELLEQWKKDALHIAHHADLGLSSTQREYFCAMIDSEIALARGGEGLRLPEAMYLRARSFVYTMLCVMAPELCPLLGNIGLDYTCDFALASVILDDADDAEEDLSAQSPTLFSCAAATFQTSTAVNYAMSMIADLERTLPNVAASLLALLGLLELKPTLILATMKTLEFSGTLKRTETLDITKAIAAGWSLNEKQ